MQTELLLVRHGETVWNAENRFQGHQDSALTPLGIAQAEAAAAYLRPLAPTALYASDLPRTLQTAQPIAVATSLTVFPEPALRERNLGIFEGLTPAELEMHHASDYACYVSREPEYVIPSGESLQQLSQRGMEIAERLARRHPGERVVIVSHGALLTTLVREIMGIALHLPSQFSLANGSISRIHFDGDAGTWTVVSRGETLHPNINQ